jgi:hypothetical protein
MLGGESQTQSTLKGSNPCARNGDAAPLALKMFLGRLTAGSPRARPTLALGKDTPKNQGMKSRVIGLLISRCAFDATAHVSVGWELPKPPADGLPDTSQQFPPQDEKQPFFPWIAGNHLNE